MPLKADVLYPVDFEEAEPVETPKSEEGRDFAVARRVIAAMVPKTGDPMTVDEIVMAVCGMPLSYDERKITRDALLAASIIVEDNPKESGLRQVRERILARDANAKAKIVSRVSGPAACRSLLEEEVKQLVREEIESRRPTWKEVTAAIIEPKNKVK